MLKYRKIMRDEVTKNVSSFFLTICIFKKYPKNMKQTQPWWAWDSSVKKFFDQDTKVQCCY